MRVSDFQTDTGAAVHATLDTKQLTSGMRPAHVDAVASLQGSDGGFIAASEVHELLIFMTFWAELCLNGLVIQLIF